MKNKFLCLSLLVLTPLLSQADFTGEKCSYVLTGSGEIQINRQWKVDSGVCFIDIHPRNSMDLKYRDYYFDNKGNFLVFNAYGYGADAETTGFRSFFIFPIVEEYPDYSIEDNGDVVVKMVSGHLFRISAKDFSIVSLLPGTFVEKPLSKTNQGGVEFSLSRGYWIDGGFKMGEIRMSNPKLKSVAKSSLSPSASCSILNNDFLNYFNHGDFVFKYEKEKLTQFLKTKCPQMKF